MSDTIKDMGLRGVYQEIWLKTAANNLANVNTAGFMRELAAFRIPEGSNLNAGAPELTMRNFTPTSTTTYTVFSTGPIQLTGNTFDVALDGPGFFCIETPNGVEYTRNGTFAINSNRELVTQEGFPVLGEGGPITIQNEAGRVQIGEKGDIFVDGEMGDRLSIRSFLDNRFLKRTSETRYIPVDENVIPHIPERTGVVQGALEMSNVNVVKEMTDLIEIHRGYESYQKIIRSMDECSSKAINEMGVLR